MIRIRLCALALLGSVGISAIGIPPVQSNQLPVTATSPGELLQRGRDFYRAGQFSEAVRVWQEAAQRLDARNRRLHGAIAQSNLSLAYQQLGQWEAAKAAIARSLQLWDLAAGNESDSETARVLAQILQVRGRLQLKTGDAELALETWQSAAAASDRAGDAARSADVRIAIAQAQQALGLYRRAIETLDRVNRELQDRPDSASKAAGLRSAGNALRVVGDFERSRQALGQSLTVARSSDDRGAIAAALLSLGNTERAANQVEAALDFYRQAAAVAPESNSRAIARLNRFSLLVASDPTEELAELSRQIQVELDRIPASRDSLYARANYAIALMDAPFPERSQLAATQLAMAIRQAKHIGDRRAESYALGNLGKLYEREQQRSEATDLTQRALAIAQAIRAPDIAYQWQWQLGRLHAATGNRNGAIAAYAEAVATLQSLRQDLVAVNPDVRFSFRESVEPVYRQFVSVLLQTEKGESPTQSDLARAREAIESLQLAELDNFFRDACLDAKPVQIDAIDRTAAVFYPIILSDRLDVILSLPDAPLRHYSVSLQEGNVEETLQNLRASLVTRTSLRYLSVAQTVYDWTIRPAEADLEASGVETLVFVPDGLFRNIPMGALYDGEQFLLEKYSVAIAPGLQLLESRPLQREGVKALTAGLTQARQGFSELPNVAVELEQIQAEIQSQILLDREFTRDQLQAAIASTPFPVVHIATHGQFSSTAEDTFILAWDERINVNELDRLLRSRQQDGNATAIELLVLSACQTATGDKRAALGLAGVAVRAGARSTLASLWYINDAATAPLMSQFYEELTDARVSKAEALRRAQVALLDNPRYRHPIYWAPYVLVGNWQ